MFDTWRWTVCWLRLSALAISPSRIPRAISPKTCRSRRVRGPAPRDEPALHARRRRRTWPSRRARVLRPAESCLPAEGVAALARPQEWPHRDHRDPATARPCRARLLSTHPERARSGALENHKGVGDLTGPLRAAASFCDGVVAAAAGDQKSAAVAFEDAAALFAASDAPYELGRARTELARTLAELGRRDRARRWARPAPPTAGGGTRPP
jgi:hypothetical protein